MDMVENYSAFVQMKHDYLLFQPSMVLVIDHAMQLKLEMHIQILTMEK